MQDTLVPRQDVPVQYALGKKKLADDLQALLADSRELLRLSAGASQAGMQAGVQALRDRLETQVGQARVALAGAPDFALSRGQEALDQVETFVEAKPWQAVFVGLGIGVLLGALAAR